MEKSAPIAIICVCDNHYAILLAALIRSIEVNHQSDEKLEFFIVEDGITKKNKSKILSGSNPEIVTIHWMVKSECLPKNVKLPVDKSSLPINIYIRLFIPHFIPKSIKRIIYLDVDMIMLEDISKLWHTDLGSKIVGAVQDQFIQVVTRWGGISNYEELGIPADNKYFNSGLMVVDIEKWRNADITNKVLNCLTAHKKHAVYEDQYGLNAVLALHWKELDLLWNRFAYSEEEKPYLIHFTGRKPIYKSYEYSEKYKEIFFYYLNMTGWKNFKPIGESSRYLKKLYNILEKSKTLLGLK
ncbi:glycosyltransferase family 8 protein [Pedobacter cryoconitis]|uniref:Lipopolysaccharide biosynthesis glycosyltransferase n=1 Tax=Pedobacter cryoconitis TaxID=188932 RepID=A0A327S1W2_9SPHI|nr:glycosyltransferase family 8 protein [Pedobacter cryoconitis]RAJ22851.1 lipopolysaccharide biosynthesis glycosyltransferase [Pedobacter cryoconitis]